MCHLLYFILLYCALSISAVMLDRVIAIAKPILYRNMVRQRSLKKCFYLLVVLQCIERGSSELGIYTVNIVHHFHSDEEINVQSALCCIFLLPSLAHAQCATMVWSCLITFSSSVTLTMQNPLTLYILLSNET